jgi:hypothetical protein
MALLMGPFLVLAAVCTLAFLLPLAVQRWRRRRRTRASVARLGRMLEFFASQDDGERAPVTVSLAATADRARRIAAAAAASQRVEVGAVVSRTGASGAELVLEQWAASGEGPCQVVAARELRPPAPPFVLDGRCADQELPPGLRAAQAAWLAGLPASARLSSSAGWLMLSVDGQLEPALAMRLLGRLDDVASALDRAT